MNENFNASLALVWRAGFDSPLDGYHVTPGDSGGGTNGGVIQATWDSAVSAGIVRGALGVATVSQLTAVLKAKFWGTTCDALPHGIDLLYFNGLVMSGGYPKLLQQCLGFMAADVDGWIGPVSLRAMRARDPETLIDALSGAHYAYLTRLPAFAEFGDGWTIRLKAAQAAGHALAAPIA